MRVQRVTGDVRRLGKKAESIFIASSVVIFSSTFALVPARVLDLCSFNTHKQIFIIILCA